VIDYRQLKVTFGQNSCFAVHKYNHVFLSTFVYRCFISGMTKQNMCKETVIPGKTDCLPCLFP